MAALLGGLPAEPSTPAAAPAASPTRPGATSASAAPTTGCPVLLAGLDGSGTTIFRTVALALDRPGIVATPLHTLERGGVRWERLVVENARRAGQTPTAEVDSVRALDPSADLAYLEAPGVPACASENRSGAGSAVTSGAAVLVLREKHGYRPSAVGGRIERAVDLPDGRRLLLARLLDAGGAEPGIALDETGALLGSVSPAPPGCDAGLAAVILARDESLDAVGKTPRSVVVSGTSSFPLTLAGQVAQALLLGGSGRVDDALGRLDEAIGGGGATTPLLLERGALRYASGRLEAAVADFVRASDSDPGSYLARFNLGISLGASGRYDAAAAALRQARDLAPENPRTIFELALALRAANQSEAARGEWESLDRLDPTLAKELRILLGF